MATIPRRLRFQQFEIDRQERSLTRDGESIPLEDKPFQLLVVLLERSGETVGREDLYAALWPDRQYLDFAANLNVAVGKLRRALAVPGSAESFLETVPRRGYRLAVQVEAAVAVGESRTSRSGRWWLAGGVGAAVVGAAVLGALVVRPASEAPTLAIVREDAAPLVAAADSEWAVALDDELLTRVAGLCPERLSVVWDEIVHSAAPADGQPLGRLDTDYLLSWSVNAAGSRVHFRLVDTRSGHYLWTETFERSASDRTLNPEGVASRVASDLAETLLTAKIAELAIARLEPVS